MARIFMLKGDINRPGHVDIPEESTTLREVVEQLGGGMVNGKSSPPHASCGASQTFAPVFRCSSSTAPTWS